MFADTRSRECSVRDKKLHGANRIDASIARQWFGFGPDDVWTFFQSHAFDFSVWEIWGALIYGGRVVVVPHLVSRSPAEFRKLLAREHVTVLNQTPSAFLALSEADAGHDPADLSLRYVIFGREALELQTLRPWFARHGDRKPALVNIYGITETTVFVTYRPIGNADVENRLPSVIGDPIPDLQVWLLDEKLVPVADEAVGEIHIGGAGGTSGYLNRPDLTAERFIQWTPPAEKSPVNLYKSGDLARRRAGELEYLGRIDHQVKIRGYRIETGEIESQLNVHSGIQSSAVVARTDGPGSEARLVAYVVPRTRGISRHDLREYLSSRLPEFMIPAAFVELESLPLTDNGKLDRRALLPPSRERPDLDVPYTQPGGQLERDVAATFERVLDIDQIGAHDNFFDLGGTSLLAVSVGARIALEVALQLERLGKSVARIVVFDMYAPGYPARMSIGKRIAYHWRGLRSQSWRTMLSYLREKAPLVLLNEGEQDRHELEKLGVVPAEILESISKGLLKASMDYVPAGKAFAGVTSVVCTRRESWQENLEIARDNGWSQFTSTGVEVHEVEAAHLDLFKGKVFSRWCG